MRTKTMLLSGVVAALTSASVLAQVYSLNTVGYINVTIVPGWSIIADQLYANGLGVPQYLSPLLDSQIGTDGSAPLNSCVLFKYIPGNPGSWATFTPDAYNYPSLVWDQSTATNTTLNPGEAAFIYNGGSTFTITFVGTVPQGNLTNAAVAKGWSLVSSVVPQAGRLDVDLGFPEVDNDYVYLYNPSTGPSPGWISWYGDEYSGTAPAAPWDAPASPEPVNPTVAVGQGFFYYATSSSPITLNPGSATPTTAASYSTMWVRSFTIN